MSLKLSQIKWKIMTNTNTDHCIQGTDKLWKKTNLCEF